MATPIQNTILDNSVAFHFPSRMTWPAVIDPIVVPTVAIVVIAVDHNRAVLLSQTMHCYSLSKLNSYQSNIPEKGSCSVLKLPIE